MNPVDPASLAALPIVIGPDRLSPYLNARNGNQSEAIRLYSWNVEASAAFLGAYAALEVGIRNAMHDQLAGIFGQADWWNAAVLAAKDNAQIDAAEDYLDERKGAGNWGVGHVVAELKTSFWEGLLASRYHARLWVAGLDGAFPHYTGVREDLRMQMQRLRWLRNRAAHHEPIFDRDLMVDHQYMCQLAGYAEADLRAWIVSHSRLPGAAAAKAQTISGSRPTRF